jgi:ribosomal protein L7Ae-like RNA K-turn-binding protein
MKKMSALEKQLTETASHLDLPIILTAEDYNKKALNLVQFARKAGQLVHGFETCKKNIANGKIKLLLLANNLAENSRGKIMHCISETGMSPEIRMFSTQEELSMALGLPFTGIIGILDANFARKIQSYLTQ